MREIILILKPKNNNIDYQDLLLKIANGNNVNFSEFNVGESRHIIDDFRNLFLDYLMEYGLNSYYKRGLLLDHVIKKGDKTNDIVPVIHRYLDKVGVDNELIIIDPYFYNDLKKFNYVQVFSQIFSKYLPNVKRFCIITNKHFEQKTKVNIETEIKRINPSINIVHKTSSNYHDRFWISNKRGKGLLLGTSMNSIGNKVALLDRLNTSDVKAIVKELKKDKLIK